MAGGSVSVVSIDEKAFNACHSLTEIVLPKTLVQIGNSAFDSCLQLKRIDIPDADCDSYTIGELAFEYVKIWLLFGCPKMTG
mmetsp:Transcript_13474/g.17563  ORF Transcript_13474/g.17563 Transcript_13474/m.17563 type:complete len:82 (-) Transcript_13474:102-347(-)